MSFEPREELQLIADVEHLIEAADLDTCRRALFAIAVVAESTVRAAERHTEREWLAQRAYAAMSAIDTMIRELRAAAAGDPS